MKNKLLSLAITLLMATTMVACTNQSAQSSQSSNTSDGSEDIKKIKIGVLQLMEHQALDSAREGFIKALEDNGYIDKANVEIDYQNAQGDQSNLLTMSQRFVSNKSDLILAIGTGAAQSTASQTSEIPILFTAVTDPVGAGLVASGENPGGNITGTNDVSPMKEQIELLLEISPKVKTIGIMYSSSEENSITQAKQIKQIIEDKNLEWVEQTVTSSNDVQQATQSIVSRCDAIYIPTDNTFASAMPIVGEIVKNSKTPVVCGDTGMTKAGGVATLGLSYYNLGYQTGEMAVRILKGEKPEDIPVESLSIYEYAISAEMAKAIGIEIPERLKQYAE